MKSKISAAAIAAAVIINIAAASATSSLTLTTYNIHSAIPNGKSNSAYQPSCSDLQNVADVLTTCAADIIALQEVRNNWNKPLKNQIPCPLDMALDLATRLNMNYAFGSTLDAVSGFPENREYLQWGSPDQWTNNGQRHGEYGNAVLTRYSLSGPPQLVKLPVATELSADKPDEPRNAVRVELKDPIGTLGKIVVYSTHFQHNNGNTRQAQMAELLQVANRDAATATVFLMGDFNHFPHKGEPDLLGMIKKAGFHDLVAEYAVKTGTKPAATMQEHHRPERIDYVFCSKPVNVTKVDVLKTQVSDHLPVTVTIAP